MVGRHSLRGSHLLLDPSLLNLLQQVEALIRATHSPSSPAVRPLRPVPPKASCCSSPLLSWASRSVGSLTKTALPCPDRALLVGPLIRRQSVQPGRSSLPWNSLKPIPPFLCPPHRQQLSSLETNITSAAYHLTGTDRSRRVDKRWTPFVLCDARSQRWGSPSTSCSMIVSINGARFKLCWALWHGTDCEFWQSSSPRSRKSQGAR